MHSSGSMVRKFGPSRKQSTGHTSTQSVYLQRMQDSVTTWVMAGIGDRCGDCARVHRFGRLLIRRWRGQSILRLGACDRRLVMRSTRKDWAPPASRPRPPSRPSGGRCAARRLRPASRSQMWSLAIWSGQPRARHHADRRVCRPACGLQAARQLAASAHQPCRTPRCRRRPGAHVTPTACHRRWRSSRCGRCRGGVSGRCVAAAAANAAVTPGHDLGGDARRMQRLQFLPRRPNTLGSPPFRRTTRRLSACLTINALIVGLHGGVAVSRACRRGSIARVRRPLGAGAGRSMRRTAPRRPAPGSARRARVMIGRARARRRRRSRFRRPWLRSARHGADSVSRTSSAPLVRWLAGSTTISAPPTRLLAYGLERQRLLQSRRSPRRSR